MLFRSLFLENSLRAFWRELLEKMNTFISLETLLILFFYRGGTFLETDSKVIYLINTGGLSKQKQRVLKEVVRGTNAMQLHHHGKSVTVQMRGSPEQSPSKARDSL